ncbi:hypothetical protein EAL2_c08810 [Peptoclostridium acidaminophilum DSM 3953]|uniref:Uncharacterized protein n=1 Tax=Peptoclostridium acidaminophilum DSM 3953 TaxID=1286171 RepID=W8U5H9_PEPAC|nr:DUF445 family protein [Peptoclostridium acidaminophilum]AHM56181.1 hypothetical protein EAL2_c08810 [Peptoclostridium acidaminophilum DSM 3953]
MQKIFFLGAVGAVIGWITNVLAIKLIFRPIRPVRIPLTGFAIWGLIPKRREEIAHSIGLVVERELLSIEEIVDKVIKEEDKANIIKAIKLRIGLIIDEKLPSIIPSTLKSMIREYVDNTVEKEAGGLIEDLSQNLVHRATSRIKLGNMVEEKINAFDLAKLEEIIISISKKELKHIEVLGGVLGLLIGLIQGVIVVYFM